MSLSPEFPSSSESGVSISDWISTWANCVVQGSQAAANLVSLSEHSSGRVPAKNPNAAVGAAAALALALAAALVWRKAAPTYRSGHTSKCMHAAVSCRLLHMPAFLANNLKQAIDKLWDELVTLESGVQYRLNPKPFLSVISCLIAGPSSDAFHAFAALTLILLFRGIGVS